MRLLDDRLRIATDLQERIISRLLGLGLAMHGTAGHTHDQELADAIAAHVNELDAIIGEIRAAVFSLTDQTPFTQVLTDQPPEGHKGG